jgi:hypothetical protein
MVHRTRKRLTKTELKKDPIAENLVKAWDFVRDHIKEVAIGAAVVLVVLVAVQALGNTSRSQNARAMARYMMADLMYEQCEQMALSGQAQQATAVLMQAYTLSVETYEQNSNRIWGQRSAVLSAKIGILLGRFDEVIELMQSMIASRPGREIEATARLHLAVALENRGSINDLQSARENYMAILEDSSDFPGMLPEAFTGLARISMSEDDYAAAAGWIERSVAARGDTTDYERHLISMIGWGQPGVR